MAKNQTPTVPLAPDQLNDAVLKALESPLTIIPSHFRINLEEETIKKVLLKFFKENLEKRGCELRDEDIIEKELKKTAYFLSAKAHESLLFVTGETGVGKTMLLRTITAAFRFFDKIQQDLDSAIILCEPKEEVKDYMLLDYSLLRQNSRMELARETPCLIIDDCFEVSKFDRYVFGYENIELLRNRLECLLKERADKNLVTILSGNSNSKFDVKSLCSTYKWSRVTVDIDMFRADKHNPTHVPR